MRPKGLLSSDKGREAFEATGVVVGYRLCSADGHSAGGISAILIEFDEETLAALQDRLCKKMRLSNDAFSSMMRPQLVAGGLEKGSRAFPLKTKVKVFFVIASSFWRCLGVGSPLEVMSIEGAVVSPLPADLASA